MKSPNPPLSPTLCPCLTMTSSTNDDVKMKRASILAAEPVLSSSSASLHQYHNWPLSSSSTPMHKRPRAIIDDENDAAAALLLYKKPRLSLVSSSATGAVAVSPSSTPPPPPPLAPKKRVRFATMASTLRRTSLVSREELLERWYQPRDYDEFDLDRYETVKALRKEPWTTLDPNQYCLRGLEQQLSKQQVLQRRLYTMRCHKAVLQQQWNLKYAGIRDPESIKAISQLFSFSASKRAHIRALMHSESNTL